MPWSTAVLLHAVPSLSGRRVAMSPPILLSGARYASRLPARDFDVKNMFAKALDFRGSLPALNRSPAEMWTERSRNLNLPPPSDTWTGRRLPVRSGDLHNAFQQLNQRLRYNNVAKEISLTVRHEKKGDKRARLRSERWRKRFADAVRKKVQLVSTIRRRGG